MKTVVIIGGGIAGTSCAEYILENGKDCDLHVIIVTPKDVIKTAVMKNELTKTLKEIDVVEKTVNDYQKGDNRLSVKVGFVIKVDITGILVIIFFLLQLIQAIKAMYTMR